MQLTMWVWSINGHTFPFVEAIYLQIQELIKCLAEGLVYLGSFALGE